jgi:hypothetical protein
MDNTNRSVHALSVELALALTALKKAELLFNLIEAAAGESADLDQAFLLAQIGAEATAAASDIAETVLNHVPGVTA